MKIIVFYHLYQYGPWEAVFNEQYGLLRSSGLFDAADGIFIGINGNQTAQFPNEKVYSAINEHPEMHEADTLKALAYTASTVPDAKILYIHSKGVSNYNKKSNDWRKMMNHFCIEKWQDCVDLLQDHDAVGCNYLNYPDNDILKPHFSGNFWWANAEYINKLDMSYLDHPNRFSREFWIGTAHGDLHEVHNSGVNHYEEEYPRELYVKS